jgi:C4-dicarboxylate-specific signal transduction histidine kinase
MAHELTQPLTAILSQAQAGRHIALRGSTDDTASVFGAIVDQAKRGSAILDRRRNWTRPPSEIVGPIFVNDAIRSVALLLRQDAEVAGIDLSTDLGPQSTMVRANQIELEQIVFNLTRNAIDAVSHGAERQVTISTRRTGGDIVIEVTDSGPGVPPAIKSRIFEPFVTGKLDGTGLGLALCQRLADRMGGELTLIEGGTGTVFASRLPVASF